MKPVGSAARLAIDTAARIREGDYIETATTGRRYLVLAVRVQKAGKHKGRQHCATVVVGPDQPVEPDARVHQIRWHRRGRA